MRIDLKDSKGRTKTIVIVSVCAALTILLVVIGIIFISQKKDNTDVETSVAENNITSDEKITSEEAKTENKVTEAVTTEEQTTEELTTEENKEWEISDIIINCSEEDLTTENEKLEYGVDTIYFHFNIIDGPSDETLSVRYEGKDPFGEFEGVFEGEFSVDENLWYRDICTDNDTGELTPFPCGEMYIQFFNAETDEPLGEKSIYICNDFEYYMSIEGPILQNNYGDCWQYSIIDNTIVIEIWMYGVAEEVGYACNGDTHYLELYDTAIGNCETFAKLLYEQLEFYGVYDSNCVFRLLDDTNTDKVLTSWYNGEKTYDIVEDAGY